MKLFQLFLCLITALSWTPAFAWREVGHFSVCEIAYQNLTAVAKAKVDSILQGKSFSEQCTWPDMVRKSKEWKHTYDWHFVNVEDNQDYFSPEVFNKKGDVISAILKAKNDLGNPRKSQAEKRPALLFLGHFVGDIHQVVHIGRKSDLGGNKLFASWFEEDHFEDVEHLRVEENTQCLGPYYVDEATDECVEVNSDQSKVNLHKIWDLLMVDKFIEENNIRSRSPYPYREYVKKINRVGQSQIKSWQNSYALDWAQESLCYRPWLYHVGNKKLGEAYYRKHVGTLNSRMLMGGYRLALTLNRIFDAKVAGEYRHLKEKEEKLLAEMKSLMDGKKSDLRLSLDQCSIGVYRAP